MATRPLQTNGNGTGGGSLQWNRSAVPQSSSTGLREPPKPSPKASPASRAPILPPADSTTEEARPAFDIGRFFQNAFCALSDCFTSSSDRLGALQSYESNSFFKRGIDRASSSINAPFGSGASWNFEEWDGTATLAEECADIIRKRMEDWDSRTDGVEVVAGWVVDVVLAKLVQGGNSGMAWMDVDLLVDAATDEALDGMEKMHALPLCLLTLPQAEDVGRKSSARHELMGVLRALTFLEGPIAMLGREPELAVAEQDMTTSLADKVVKACMFIIVMTRSPHPHRHIRASSNQRSLRTHEADLHRQGLQVYAKFFSRLVLPVETRLEPIFQVPMERNEHFYGSEKLFDNAWAILGGSAATPQAKASPGHLPNYSYSSGPGKKKPQVLFVTGPIGIGKTEFAREFAYRFKQHYDAVLWLDAHPAVLEEGFASLKSILGAQVGETDTLAKNVRAVRRALESGRRFLLIFDNLEDEAQLENVAPLAGQVSLLVTTEKKPKDAKQCITLDVAVGEDVWQVLNSFGFDDADSISDDLAKAVHGHPLAIQAAAILLRRDFPWEKLLSQLKWAGSGRPWMERASLEVTRFQDNSSLKIILDIWIRHMEEKAPSREVGTLAVAMFDCAGWFGPQPIPMPLLGTAGGALISRLDPSEVATLATRAAQHLEFFWLASIRPTDQTGKALLFHPFLQEYSRSRSRSRLASNLTLLLINETLCVHATRPHFDFAWSLRPFYETKRECASQIWQVGLRLCEYLARNNHAGQALSLCDEILGAGMGPDATEVKIEALAMKACVLGHQTDGLESHGSLFEGALVLNTCMQEMERQPQDWRAKKESLSLFLHVHYLYFQVMLGKQTLEDSMPKIQMALQNLEALSDRVGSRRTMELLGEYGAASQDCSLLAFTMQDLAELVVAGGYAVQGDGMDGTDKWLHFAVELQEKALFFFDRAFPEVHYLHVPALSSTAALYFRLYSIALSQQHFQDAFRLKAESFSPLRSPPGSTEPNPHTVSPAHSEAAYGGHLGFSKTAMPDFVFQDDDSDEDYPAPPPATGGRTASPLPRSSSESVRAGTPGGPPPDLPVGSIIARRSGSPINVRVDRRPFPPSGSDDSKGPPGIPWPAAAPSPRVGGGGGAGITSAAPPAMQARAHGGSGHSGGIGRNGRPAAKSRPAAPGPKGAPPSVRSPGTDIQINVARRTPLETVWGVGGTPSWLTAEDTFGSAHMTPEVQRNAARIFTGQAALARLGRDGYLEALSFAMWSLVEPSSIHEVRLLDNARSLLISHLKRMSKQPRAFLKERHRLRILLLYIFFELGSRTVDSPGGVPEKPSKPAGIGPTMRGGGPPLGRKSTSFLDDAEELLKETPPAVNEWEGLEEGEDMNQPGQGGFQRACQLARNCLTLAENHAPSEEWVPLYSLMLARCLIRVQEYKEAETQLKLTLAAWTARGAAARMKVATTYNLLAVCYWLQRQVAKASGFLERSKMILEQEGKGAEMQLADVLDALGRVYAVQGHQDEAYEVLNCSLRIRKRRLTTKHPAIAFNLTDLAKVLEAKGEIEEAKSLKMTALTQVGGRTEEDIVQLRVQLQASLGPEIKSVQAFYGGKTTRLSPG
eukprot:TRINITY_DN571_c0_g4_i1.p1 TRINITY_DN571_c0_g4~~TRINITY_DN571_c0_g4_i1.p1  ORF type:complete len:1595 (+),score=291.78 TRINITY_DN571_c0_g4_i1:1264-6048(+)